MCGIAPAAAGNAARRDLWKPRIPTHPEVDGGLRTTDPHAVSHLLSAVRRVADVRQLLRDGAARAGRRPQCCTSEPYSFSLRAM